jgi:glutamate-1-semialdehyde 2,1-aminomutase
MTNSARQSHSARLSEALDEAAQRYSNANPSSAAQFNKALAAMPGGNTRSVLYYSPFPLAIARGQAARLWDADGHEYRDFIAEFSAGVYGHSNPVIRRAIDTALDGGINLSGHNLIETELAATVCDRFPTVERVRFTNSGTEANLLLLAAAKAYTKRPKIVVFNGGYHGGVLSFGSGQNPVNVPHEFLLATYNDIASVEALFNRHGSEIATILVEPMQGASGCIVGQPEFLRALRDLCTRFGALLAFDEVMTSRLAPGGMQALLDIKADLTSLGKYIGGGMSFGAFGGREDIMAQFDPRKHGALAHAGTFNNNVLTMSAGVAGLRELYTPQAAVEINQRGDRFRDALNQQLAASGVAMRFFGLGSLMNLQPTDKEIRSIDDLAGMEHRLKDLYFFHMIENGVYLARRGYMTLSLPVTEQDMAHVEAVSAGFIERYRTLLPANQ